VADRWRKANPKIVKIWALLEEAAVQAVKYPGRIFGLKNKKAHFKVEDRWLFMRLPSGRKIAYLDPELVDGKVEYTGSDTYSRKWGRTAAYGGRLLQNYCEGVARDRLTAGMLNMEQAGYPTVLTVHDEGVFEVPKGRGSMEEAIRLMTAPQKWEGDLPVQAKGWRGRRFRK